MYKDITGFRENRHADAIQRKFSNPKVSTCSFVRSLFCVGRRIAITLYSMQKHASPHDKPIALSCTLSLVAKMRAQGTLLCILSVSVVLLVHAQTPTQTGIDGWDPIRLVDTRIGNGGFGWGVGGDNPSPQYPFGSMRVGPDTDQDLAYLYFTHFGGYCVDDNNVRAFSHTHLVGAGANDYGNFGIMPIVKTPQSLDDVANHKYRTKFTHDDETAVPGLYEVNLPAIATRARLTSTGTHGAIHLYHYNLTSTPSRQGLLLDACHSTMPDNQKACLAGNVTVSRIQVNNDSGMPTSNTDPNSTPAVVIRSTIKFKGSLTGRGNMGGIYMHFYALVRAFLTTEPFPSGQPYAADYSPVFPTDDQVNLNKALRDAQVIAREPLSLGVWNGTKLATLPDATFISGEASNGMLGAFVDFGSLGMNDVAAQCNGTASCHAKIAIAAGISWISPQLAEMNILSDLKKLNAARTVAAIPNHDLVRKLNLPVQSLKGLESLLSDESVGRAANTGSALALSSSFHFLAAQKRLQDVWREKLAKIKIGFAPGVNPPRGINGMSIQFATALYHTMLAPSTFTESNNSYLDPNDKVQLWPYYSDKSVALTDMSIWDTFRTVNPLFNVIEPHIARDIVRSQLEMAKASGDVERWPIANVMSGCMIGDHVLSIIADFALTRVFGVKNVTSPALNADRKLIADLYPYMRQRATSANVHKPRPDLERYTRDGYVSREADIEAASLTLSFALDDFAIAVVAKALNKTSRPPRALHRMFRPISEPYLTADGHWETDESDYERFLRQSKNYVNIYEPVSQFMCPRSAENNADGSPQFTCPPFWQLAITYILTNPMYYVEGDAWQWLWFTQQDPEGLVKLMGKDAFVSKLTTFIEQSDKWTGGNTLPNPYYWSGNEPDIQAPWMFSFAGRHDLTSKYVRWIVETSYSEKWDGLPGNDDYGTLSAWLVWATLGMYPFPATGKFVLSAPLVSEAEIQVPSLYSNSTKTVNIRTQFVDNPSTPQLGQFLSCVKLDGVPLKEPFVQYDELFAETSTSNESVELLYLTTNVQPTSGAWCA